MSQRFFDIKHPVGKRIIAVKETTVRYYRLLKLFIKTSQYGLIIIIAVVTSLVLVPFITVATMPHTNTVKFIPTIVHLDPMSEAGWQNIGNIQNIDLSNQAQLAEFNKDNSSFLNVVLAPPVLPTEPGAQLPAEEETPPTEGEHGSPQEPVPPSEPGPPGQVELPEPAGNKDGLPPVIEDKKEEKSTPPGQEKKESEQSTWLNNKFHGFFASLRQTAMGLTAFAQTDGAPPASPDESQSEPPAETPPENAISPPEETLEPPVDAEPPDASSLDDTEEQAEQEPPAEQQENEPVLPADEPAKQPVEQSESQPEVVLPNVDGEEEPAPPAEPQEKVSIFTIRKNIVLSSFQPDIERDAASVVEAVRLNLSMGVTGRLGEDDELLVGYNVGDNGTWNQLASFTQDKDYSNFRNGGYFIYDLPADTNIRDLKIEIFSLSNNDPGIPDYEPLPMYIDAAWLEVDYIDEVEDPGIVEELTDQIEFSFDESPQFEFEYDNKNRGTLDKIIAFFLENRDFVIEKVELIDAYGNVTEVGISVEKLSDIKWAVKLPEDKRDIVPGKYILRITAKEDEQLYVEDQPFYWGVLAINVNKSIYLPGEKSYIQMAALTDNGNTICDANLYLEVTSSSGAVATPEVKQSGECELNNVTDTPDYFSYYQTDEVGIYQLKLTRLNENNKEIHHIVSSFEVSDAVPYEVERVGPTRLYPPAKYKMVFNIKANESFSGNIIESIPNSFTITPSEEYQVIYGGPESKIIWQVNLSTGDLINLSYEFDAPDTAPALYLLGPLKLGDWGETRFWQVAADATATYNFVGCGTDCDTSTGWWASGDDVDLFPFGGNQANRNTHTEATDAQYDLIESSNDSRWATTDPGSGDFLFFWNEMTINQTPASISQIDLTFEGALINGSTTGTGQIYVLKTGTAWETDANWVAVGTSFALTTTEASFTRSITSAFTDYIPTSGGLMTWGIYENQTTTSLSVDYVGAVVTYTPSPVLSQNHYWWRDDSTTLDTYPSGWLGTQDTLYSPLRKNITTRLRIEIANTGEAAATSYNYRLQSALLNGTCAASTFADVPVTATTEAWEMVDSTQYTGETNITVSRLTAQGTFTNPGKAVEDPANQTTAYSLTNGYYTEFEYAIKATNYAADNSTYCFRLTNAGSTTNFSYSIYPQITTDVGGGRIWSSGFELQSVTAGVEWSSVSSTPLINTSIKHGGSASLEIASLSSTTEKGTTISFTNTGGGNQNGPFWLRVYFMVNTAPTTENRIIAFESSTAADRAYITIDNSRQLRLYDEDGIIGSASNALSLNTWYRVEMKIDASGGVNADTVEARIDGINFASSSARDLSTGVGRVNVGGNLNSESQTVGTWYFDDVAINENVGASQNSYPGPGVIVHLKPNADGDNVAWTNTYTSIDEVTPNDITDYILSSTLNAIEEAGVEDPDTVGIRSSDTINIVQVGARTRCSATVIFPDPSPVATFRIKSQSNGTIQTYSILSDNTPWYTNRVMLSSNRYMISSYSKPEGGIWTPSNLRTVQIGAQLTTDAGVPSYQISTFWLLVEYVPASNPPDNQTQYNATHDTVIPTGGTTADGITTNLFLDSYVSASALTEIITPKVEVRDISTSFSNVVTHTGQDFVYGTSFPGPLRAYCSVYDDLNEQMVVWGGYDDKNAVNSTDTWVLSMKPGYRSQWKKLTTAGTLPPATRAHVCVYDSLNDRLVVFGGWNGTTYLNTPYFLSLPSSGTPTWSQPSPLNGTPPSATGQLLAQAIYDPSPSRMILYGGYYSTDTDIDAVYELTLPSGTSATWNNLGLTTGPSAVGAGRDSAVMAYDADSDRAVMAMGHINAVTDEVWALNLAAGSEAWTQIIPGGTAPAARDELMGVFQPDYSGTDDRLIIHGGYNGTTIFDDLQELALPEAGGGTWTDKSPPAGNRPFPTYVGAPLGVYDSYRQVGLIMPGYDGTYMTNNNNLAIDLSSPTGNLEFRTMAELRYLTVRDGNKMEFDPINGDIVMFGGATNTVAYAIHEAETWKFKVSDNSWRDAGPDTTPIVREFDNLVYDGYKSELVGPTTGAGSYEAILGGTGGSGETFQAAAQIFTASSSYSLSRIKIYTTITTGSPTDGLYMDITSTSPSGSVLGTSQNNTNLTNAAWNTFDFTTPVSITSGNTYAIRLFRVGARDASNAWGWRDGATNVVTGNPWYRSNNAWTENTGETYDRMFELFSNEGRMVMCFGLSDVQPNYMNDCWQLSLPTAGKSKWTNLNPAGTLPTERWGAASVYDDLNDRLVIFGGQGGSANTYLSDVAFLSLGATPTWSVPASGTPPSARRFATAIYDPGRDRMVMFGGQTSSAVLQDTWQLTLPSSGDPVWTQLAPTGGPPSIRRGHTAIYDPDRGDGTARMVMFGGVDNAGTVHNNEVWELTLPASGDGVWTLLSAGTAPSARRSHGAAYDSINDRMIVYGGRDATSFFGDTWSLSLGASPAWTQLMPDVKIPATVAVSSLTAGTSYHWQAWFTGSVSGDSAKASYGGNSDTPPAGVDFTIAGSGITVSGNVYNYEGTTPLTECDADSGTYELSLKVPAVGTPYTASCSNVDGSFEFTGVTTPSAGAGMVVWINNIATDGALIIRYDGAGNSTGHVFWDNAVTMTSDDATAVTNTNMDTYDNVNDGDIPYTVTGTALTVNDGFELHITTAKTYTPGGTIATDPSSTPATTDGDLHIDGTGTLNMEANALSVGGDFVNEGTMTFTSGQTTTFTATAAGHSITDGGENFENIIFSGASGGWSFFDATIINKDLTMTAGTLSGTVDVTVNGGDVTGNGDIAVTSGLFTVDGASTTGFGGDTAWDFSSLTFSGASTATTAIGTGAIAVAETLTVGASHTLNAGSKVWILSDNTSCPCTPFVISGIFNADSSTFRYTSTAATTVTRATYNHLQLQPANVGGPVYTLAGSGTLTINGDLTISDGTNAVTVNADTSDPIIDLIGNLTLNNTGIFIASATAGFSVGGSWTVGATATFTHSSSSAPVIFDAPGTARTINSGGDPFYNVEFNNAAGGWSPLTNTMTIANDLTMTAGTVDNTNGSADIVVNGNVACGGTCGTITLTAGTFLQSVGAVAKNFGTNVAVATNWKFFNLTFTSNTGVIITTSSIGTGTIEVANALTISANSTMNAGNRTYILSGTIAAPFVKTGTFQYSTGTMRFTGNSASVVVNALSGSGGSDGYYNLEIMPSGAVTYTLATGTYQVNNNLTIGDGAVSGIVSGATNDPIINVSGNLTIDASGTLIAPSANTLSVTGDLTVTGTLQGTGNVTVNGNVTGAGTITMTGGIFEQRVAADKNFGSSAGTNNWTFITLTFSNSNGTATPITITPNTGFTGGQIIISTAINIGKDGDAAGATTTFDNETSNDRIFDINGNITISTKGAFSASSTAAFNLAGNFTDNKATSGGFTPNSGTVTIDGAGTSTFDGANTPAITFFNLISTTAGKTLTFTAAKTFRIDGKLTITGVSGNQITINSTDPTTPTRWKIDHQGTEDVTYAYIKDSGCETGTTNISLNNTSTNGGDNGTCWLFPSLTFSINTVSINMDLNAGNSWTTNTTNTLTVTTTATSGYNLTAYETGLLTHTAYGGVTILNYTDGGAATYLTPTLWTVTCGADSNKCGFGYNTNDTDVSQFLTNYFAPFSQTPPGDIVSKSTAPQFTDPLGTIITYRSSVSAIQKAGQYQTTIIYIVTPQF